MKQALVSLIRTVVRAHTAKAAALPELSADELRQVAGGSVSVESPKSVW